MKRFLFDLKTVIGLLCILTIILCLASCDKETKADSKNLTSNELELHEAIEAGTAVERVDLNPGYVVEGNDTMLVGKIYAWDEIPEAFREQAYGEAERAGLDIHSKARTETLTSGANYVYFSPDRTGSGYGSELKGHTGGGQYTTICSEDCMCDYGCTGWYNNSYGLASSLTSNGFVHTMFCQVSHPGSVPQIYSIRLSVFGSDGFAWLDIDDVTDAYSGFGNSIAFTCWTSYMCEAWYSENGATSHESAIAIY